MRKHKLTVVVGVVALLAVGAMGRPTPMPSAGRGVVELPDGSVDALADAIAEAGPHGVVLVREGLHTESGTVIIDIPITIRGEPGAVFEIDTCPDPDNPLAGQDAIDVDAAFHILGARKVSIIGLEIRPTAMSACPEELDGIGGTAILIEDAANTFISQNYIHHHQNGVIVEEVQRARVWDNTIEGVFPIINPWVTGITVVNGAAVMVVGNDISATFIGLWACDKNGQAFENSFHGNANGLVLCKVPLFVEFFRISGQITGAEFPATNWSVRQNVATDNFNAGYIVIDGSNRNVLVNNAAANNDGYDIRLEGWFNFFGFCVSPSHDNMVIVNDPFITVNDCGDDNRIIGGDQNTPPDCAPCN